MKHYRMTWAVLLALTGACTVQTDRWSGMQPEYVERAAAEAERMCDRCRQMDDTCFNHLREFYRAGSEDPLVTRKVCREVVLALMWDALHEDLDTGSARRIRAFAFELSRTADADLSAKQRARLHRIIDRTNTELSP